MSDRRERLDRARLYLVCGDQPESFLRAALRGGVDIVQLRIKGGDDATLLDAASRFRTVCAEHGALLILNDRPDLVRAADVDGAHVGQDDMPVAAARELAGGERLIGLSTHTPDQIDASDGADYIGVGPIHATPTKPGRPAVGLDLVRHAAAHAAVPFFAIGGIDPSNVAAVCGAGARRVAVVRALTGAQQPALAARALRDALDRAWVEEEVGVGPA